MNEFNCWITGGSRGIGLEIALLLSESVKNVFISASTADSFNHNMPRISKLDNVFIIPCDVTLSNEVESAFNKIKDISGNVDVLINNAGIGLFSSLLDSSEQDFDRTIAVNIKGAYLCIKAVLPEMISQKRGMIINILSVAVDSKFTNTSLYAASKAGLRTMSRILREEVRAQGVRIIDIVPGATNTDIWDDESREKFGKRMMSPLDVAKAIKGVIELNSEGNLITEELIIRPIEGDL